MNSTQILLRSWNNGWDKPHKPRAITINDIIRTKNYYHAVPCLAPEQMRIQLAETAGPEAAIIWLRDPANYPVYLRETTECFNQAYTVPKEILERKYAGDSLDHVVAVAIHHLDNDKPLRGFFERRLWYVKGYDAFHGHTDDSWPHPKGGESWYATGGPSGAVKPQSITPNRKSEAGWNDDVDRDSIRPTHIQVFPKDPSFYRRTSRT